LSRRRNEPTFLTAARRANADEPLSPTQKAWLACARRKARSRHARTYDAKALKDLAAQLPKILSSVEGFAELPDLLADVGVRLVYVEAFPSSKISGSAFLLDDDRNHPVIAISGRGRRLDIVLLTLLYEVAHLIRGDVKRRGTILDEENGETIGDEKAADKMASDWLLPADLEPPTSFLRHGWVESVAAAYGVHPCGRGPATKDGSPGLANLPLRRARRQLVPSWRSGSCGQWVQGPRDTQWLITLTSRCSCSASLNWPQPRVECHPNDVAGTFIASVSRDVLTPISRIRMLTAMVTSRRACRGLRS
jgi:hypothetical protein